MIFTFLNWKNINKSMIIYNFLYYLTSFLAPLTEFWPTCNHSSKKYASTQCLTKKVFATSFNKNNTWKEWSHKGLHVWDLQYITCDTWWDIQAPHAGSLPAPTLRLATNTCCCEVNVISVHKPWHGEDRPSM